MREAPACRHRRSTNFQTRCGVVNRITRPRRLLCRLPRIGHFEVTDEARQHRNAAEGTGAASLPGAMRQHERWKGKRIGITVAGANVDSGMFARVLLGKQFC